VNEPSEDLLLTLGKISYWWNEVNILSKQRQTKPGELKLASKKLLEAQKDLRSFKFKGHYEIYHD
jgi:hypothetical protein